MAASFTWLGTWTNGFVYGKDNVVQYSGVVYVSVNPNNFTSTTNPSVDTTNWNVMLTGNVGAQGAAGAQVAG